MDVVVVAGALDGQFDHLAQTKRHIGDSFSATPVLPERTDDNGEDNLIHVCFDHRFLPLHIR